MRLDNLGENLQGIASFTPKKLNAVHKREAGSRLWKTKGAAASWGSLWSFSGGHMEWKISAGVPSTTQKSGESRAYSEVHRPVLRATMNGEQECWARSNPGVTAAGDCVGNRLQYPAPRSSKTCIDRNQGRRRLCLQASALSIYFQNTFHRKNINPCLGTIYIFRGQGKMV